MNTRRPNIPAAQLARRTPEANGTTKRRPITHSTAVATAGASAVPPLLCPSIQITVHVEERVSLKPEIPAGGGENFERLQPPARPHLPTRHADGRPDLVPLRVACGLRPGDRQVPRGQHLEGLHRAPRQLLYPVTISRKVTPSWSDVILKRPKAPRSTSAKIAYHRTAGRSV